MISLLNYLLLIEITIYVNVIISIKCILKNKTIDFYYKF